MSGPLLVTGGSGFLGTAIRRIHAQALFLSSADGDLRDPGVADRMISALRPSVILHLAGRVGGVKDNAAHNVAFFEDNALINAAVLSGARRARVPKVISLLSSCAFPLFADRPTTEDDLHAALPYDGNTGYGYAKRMLDLHTRLAAEQQQLAWTTLTPVTMYGPHDRFDPESGHVVGSLIRRCWEAKTLGIPYTVWGSGRAVRQFIYVDDVARLLVDLCGRVTGPATTILAPDDGITIRMLAEAVARAMDYQGPILFDSAQPEGVLVKRLRSTRSSSHFPGFSFTPLEIGLAETVQWFLRNRARQAAVLPVVETLCSQP